MIDTERYVWTIDEIEKRGRKYSPDQPRDERGRFGEGSGTVGEMQPGSTDLGLQNGPKLDDALGGSAHEIAVAAGHAYPTATAPGEFLVDKVVQGEVKQANVVEIGDALTERAANDPALAAQLDAMGQRTSELSTIGYMHGWLGVQEGEDISNQELGARQLAAQMQDSWMSSASDTSETTWALQLAVADRLGVDTGLDALHAAAEGGGQEPSFIAGHDLIAFGVENAIPIGSGPPSFEDVAQQIADSPGVKAYVDEVYSRTQDYLKANDITEITAYRGVYFETSGNDPLYSPAWSGTDARSVTLNPASSFSTSRNTAEDFSLGGSVYTNAYVMEVTVPADRVFATPLTGPGCLQETELLLAGGPAKANVEMIQEGEVGTEPPSPSFQFS